MAPPSFSPTASTSSHTLSAQSINPPAMDLNSPASTDALLAALSSTRHSFLQPQAFLHTSALALAKRYLDPLALGVSETQARRQQEARKKRKRDDEAAETQILQLKQVHLDGFGVDQVWEQARRVLDAAVNEVERSLPEQDESIVNGVGRKVRVEEEESTEDDSIDEEEEQSDLSEDFRSENDEQEEEIFSAEEEDDDEEEDAEDDESELEDEDMKGFSDEDRLSEASETYVADPHGLNDGFFSIDDFNKQSEFLEQQDERGDMDDVASDEEEVDWGTDPMRGGSTATPQNQGANEDSDEEDEEDGPTFGNMDLNAAEGASDVDMDDASIEDEDIAGLGGMTNTNNIMYADFFAPPPKKGSKKKKGRPNPHNFPPKDPNASKELDTDNIERTMSAVHRNLFEDSDPEDSEDPLSDVDPSDPKSRRSTHERRQAKLAEEIRRLEAANVAKREWVLSGEAKSNDRPVNSLLEENLDFERVGKPVPVITAEISEDIESLIKRRILAQEFDEVIRRRPDDLATGPSSRRGRFELEDTKATKGLAELYEEEHLRKTDPNYVDARDEKLKKEHNEIEALWKDVSAKLDSLSSWHYKPKPAAPSLEVRVDAAAITLEDARPTAGGEVASASMLAPQEVYMPGQEKTKGEVVTKAGLPVAKEEMSREQKLRRRRREKEREKKATGQDTTKKPENKHVKEKKQVVDQLKKGGVKVIGKKGEIRDASGVLVKEKQSNVGAGNFKL